MFELQLTSMQIDSNNPANGNNPRRNNENKIKLYSIQACNVFEKLGERELSKDNFHILTIPAIKAGKRTFDVNIDIKHGHLVAYADTREITDSLGVKQKIKIENPCCEIILPAKGIYQESIKESVTSRNALINAVVNAVKTAAKSPSLSSKQVRELIVPKLQEQSVQVAGGLFDVPYSYARFQVFSANDVAASVLTTGELPNDLALNLKLIEEPMAYLGRRDINFFAPLDEVEKLSA